MALAPRCRPRSCFGGKFRPPGAGSAAGWHPGLPHGHERVANKWEGHRRRRPEDLAPVVAISSPRPECRIGTVDVGRRTSPPWLPSLPRPRIGRAPSMSAGGSRPRGCHHFPGRGSEGHRRCRREVSPPWLPSVTQPNGARAPSTLAGGRRPRGCRSLSRQPRRLQASARTAAVTPAALTTTTRNGARR